MSKHPISGCFDGDYCMPLETRSLSPQESRVILALREMDRSETTRTEIATPTTKPTTACPGELILFTRMNGIRAD